MEATAINQEHESNADIMIGISHLKIEHENYKHEIILLAMSLMTCIGVFNISLFINVLSKIHHLPHVYWIGMVGMLLSAIVAFNDNRVLQRKRLSCDAILTKIDGLFVELKCTTINGEQK